jgi:hypothetical protein
MTPVNTAAEKKEKEKKEKGKKEKGKKEKEKEKKKAAFPIPILSGRRHRDCSLFPRGLYNRQQIHQLIRVPQ